MLERIKHCFTESIQTQIEVAETLPNTIANAAQLLVQTLLSGQKILTCGNGASSANLQQFTMHLLNGYEIIRPSLPCLSLNAGNVLTTVNCHESHSIYASQLRALAQQGDILLTASPLGNCPEIIKAIEVAVTKDLFIIALTGADGGEIAGLLGEQDIEIRIPSRRQSRIEELHLLTLNCLCDLIDNSLFPHKED